MVHMPIFLRQNCSSKIFLVIIYSFLYFIISQACCKDVYNIAYDKSFIFVLVKNDRRGRLPFTYSPPLKLYKPASDQREILFHQELTLWWSWLSPLPITRDLSAPPITGWFDDHLFMILKCKAKIMIGNQYLMIYFSSIYIFIKKTRNKIIVKLVIHRQNSMLTQISFKDNNHM